MRSFPKTPQVQLDSITSNELGDPDALVSVAGRPDSTTLADWRSQPNLGALLCHSAMHDCKRSRPTSSCVHVVGACRCERLE